MKAPMNLDQIINEHPIGLIVTQPREDAVTCLFWQSPKPDEKIFCLNMLHGLMNNMIESKRLTKEEILTHLTKSFGE